MTLPGVQWQQVICTVTVSRSVTWSLCSPETWEHETWGLMVMNWSWSWSRACDAWCLWKKRWVLYRHPPGKNLHSVPLLEQLFIRVPIPVRWVLFLICRSQLQTFITDNNSWVASEYCKVFHTLTIGNALIVACLLTMALTMTGPKRFTQRAVNGGVPGLTLSGFNTF